MDWFLSGTTGWVLTALIFVGFGYMWYRMRRAKATKVSKHWPPIGVDGFGYVNVPKKTFEGAEISIDEARLVANHLYEVQLAVWQLCIDEYGVTHETNEAFQQNARGWCVDEVGITNDPEVMDEHHPYIEWNAPHGGIELLLQQHMYYWFAHEVHNVFRYVLHGMKHIYQPVDDEDGETFNFVWSEISSRYGG